MKSNFKYDPTKILNEKTYPVENEPRWLKMKRRKALRLMKTHPLWPYWDRNDEEAQRMKEVYFSQGLEALQKAIEETKGQKKKSPNRSGWVTLKRKGVLQN